ncbi:hypothetical protein [Hymenobacter lucidus]|uniref:Lipoprotein n=1 Tax=Hymenobacter lucidus TaxID=2880930 RepID=A0ABS8ALV4_9BACT|nr:hypothetical protein [Hymenobacter lucidus]MCB2407190.1 hypothetical protein [Hymenobacter lucidus]
MPSFRLVILCAFTAMLLLTGCSSATDAPAGWWSHTNKDAAAAPYLHHHRARVEARAVVPDTTLHRFVRGLLAQGLLVPGADPRTTFFAGNTFLDRAPAQLPPNEKCEECYGPDLSGNLLGELVRQGQLPAADSAFMRRQLASAVEFRLRPSLLPGFQIVPVDTLWAIRKRLPEEVRNQQARVVLGERYKTRYFFYVSRPLFSRDLQTAIVDISLFCGGVGACGGSTTYVLRREKGFWRIVQEHERWVS